MKFDILFSGILAIEFFEHSMNYAKSNFNVWERLKCNHIDWGAVVTIVCIKPHIDKLFPLHPTNTKVLSQGILMLVY